MSTLIPYRNMPALVGYYLAVFALIPCLGLVLGAAAFFLGLQGLKRAHEAPQVRGRTHAWVAVILGGVCALGNLAALFFFLSSR